MNLGEALQGEMDRLWRDSAAITSPVSSSRGRIARMKELERLSGGPKGAAAAVGVHPDTWTRWKKTGSKTRQPSLANQRSLANVYDIATRPSRQRRFERRLQNLRPIVGAEIKWGNSDTQYNRTRQRNPTNLNAMDLRSLAAPWKAGNRAEMADRFERAVSEEYRRPDDTDGSPGIQFEGNQVTVRFA